MKYFFLFLISICLKSPKQDHSCSEVKIGKFYNRKLNGIIIRDKNYQTEILEEKGFNCIWKLHWTSDCDYFMTLEKDKSKPKPTFSKGDTIYVRIQKIDDEGYSWAASYKKYNLTGYYYKTR